MLELFVLSIYFILILILIINYYYYLFSSFEILASLTTLLHEFVLIRSISPISIVHIHRYPCLQWLNLCIVVRPITPLPSVILNPSSCILIVLLGVLLYHAIILNLLEFHFITIVHSIRDSLNIILFLWIDKAIRSLNHIHLISKLTFSLWLKYLIMEIYRVIIFIRWPLTVLISLSIIIRMRIALHQLLSLIFRTCVGTLITFRSWLFQHWNLLLYALPRIHIG